MQSLILLEMLSLLCWHAQVTLRRLSCDMGMWEACDMGMWVPWEACDMGMWVPWEMTQVF